MFQFGDPHDIVQLHLELAGADPELMDKQHNKEYELEIWKVELVKRRVAYNSAKHSGANAQILTTLQDMHDEAFRQVCASSDILMDAMRAGKHKYLTQGGHTKLHYETLFFAALAITGRRSKYRHELNWTPEDLR